MFLHPPSVINSAPYHLLAPRLTVVKRTTSFPQRLGLPTIDEPTSMSAALCVASAVSATAVKNASLSVASTTPAISASPSATSPSMSSTRTASTPTTCVTRRGPCTSPPRTPRRQRHVRLPLRHPQRRRQSRHPHPRRQQRAARGRSQPRRGAQHDAGDNRVHAGHVAHNEEHADVVEAVSDRHTTATWIASRRSP